MTSSGQTCLRFRAVSGERHVTSGLKQIKTLTSTSLCDCNDVCFVLFLSFVPAGRGDDFHVLPVQESEGGAVLNYSVKLSLLLLPFRR